MSLKPALTVTSAIVKDPKKPTTTAYFDDFPTVRQKANTDTKSTDDVVFNEGVKSHQQAKFVPPVPKTEEPEGYLHLWHLTHAASVSKLFFKDDKVSEDQPLSLPFYDLCSDLSELPEIDAIDG